MRKCWALEDGVGNDPAVRVAHVVGFLCCLDLRQPEPGSLILFAFCDIFLLCRTPAVVEDRPLEDGSLELSAARAKHAPLLETEA